jgi:NAD(P)-dependent dehydrogenase (short-subunit alcohol dehydrogenase family)
MNNIFITGANRGIGLELTKQSLMQGNRVLATYRSNLEIKNLKALQQKFTNQLEIFSLDVENETSIRSCFNKVEKKKLTIDLLFNNAGIMDWSDFENISLSSLENIYKTNLIGPLLVTRNAVPLMNKNDSALIVNMSSRLGSIDLRGETQLGGAIGYQCSKSALNMLTKQTSIDLKPLGIRVISLSPGWVKTEMGGTDAKYEVEESVSLLLQTLEHLERHKSGIFIGEDGKEIPW